MGFLINSCPLVRRSTEKKEREKKKRKVTIPRPRIVSHTLKRSLTSSVMRRVIGVVLRGRDLGRDFFHSALLHRERSRALSRVSSSNDLVDNPRLRIFLPLFFSLRPISSMFDSIAQPTWFQFSSIAWTRTTEFSRTTGFLCTFNVVNKKRYVGRLLRKDGIYRRPFLIFPRVIFLFFLFVELIGRKF